MPVPTYDQFIEPVLRYLAEHPDGAPARDVHDAAAASLHLNDADRAEVLPAELSVCTRTASAGRTTVLSGRGFQDHLRRGYWQLTDQGRAFASSNPAPLTPDTVEKIATEHKDVRLRPPTDNEESSATPVEAPARESAKASPDDRLEQALSELRQAVKGELVDVLSQVSPEYFETIVLNPLP